MPVGGAEGIFYKGIWKKVISGEDALSVRRFFPSCLGIC